MSASGHTITLKFTDGVEHQISVTDGQSVLDAAIAAEAPVLYQCKSGSCGSCLCHLEDGDISMISGQASSLLRAEQEAGARLMCVSHAGSDGTLSLGYASNVAGTGATKAMAFIDKIERLADDVVGLSLELAEGSWIDFRPGQFVQVSIPGAEAVRSYSMASTPADLPRIDLLIRLLPQGAMSDYLRDRAQVDDVIQLEGPFGAFFLREKVRATHVLVAGGTGLAPMISIIDALRQTPGRKPNVLLSFGCANEAGLFYRDEIALRQSWMPSLKVRVSVDKGPAPDDVLIGNPVQAITADDVEPDAVAYLCGPPGMVNAARNHLEQLGLKPENIFAEQFVASN